MLETVLGLHAPQQSTIEPRIRTSAFTQAGVHSRNRSSIRPEPKSSPTAAPETTALSSITSSRASTQVTALAAIKLAGIQSNRHFLQRGPLLIFRVGLGFRERLKGTLTLTTRIEAAGVKRCVGSAASGQAQPENRQHPDGMASLHV